MKRKPVPQDPDADRTEAHEGDVIEQRLSRSLTARLAPLLDEAYTIPGTNIRFGWDAIIGLVPVLGDTVGLGISTVLLLEARLRGVRFPVLLKMAGWILLDWFVGSIPLVGDIADVFIKPNMRLLRMLEDELEAKARRRSEGPERRK